MSVRTINLHEQSSVSQLTEHLDKFHVDEKIGQSILDAVEVLKNYKETIDLSPPQVMVIFSNLQISDTFTPCEMKAQLVSNPKAFVLRKKFFDSHISKKKFESTLLEIISELGRSISGDILNAIVSLVKNFSVICVECQSMNTLYKELCFKFFCRDDERNEVLVLIINLDYGLKNMSKSFIRRACHYMRFGLHLSFFGAVIRTSLAESASDLSDNKEQANV